MQLVPRAGAEEPACPALHPRAVSLSSLLLDHSSVESNALVPMGYGRLPFGLAAVT